MKITIVTATYNSENTLRDTLNSIFSQNHEDIECIVIDGKSQDKTLDIIKEYSILYPDRLKYISESDRGLYDAMNKGISMATGDIIGVLNSDDFYASNDVLSTIVKEIEDVDVVYGDLDFVDFHDTNKVIRTWRGSQHFSGAFLKGWHPAHPTFYAKRELYEKYGGFDLGFDISADFELMLRFIEKHQSKNKYVHKVFVKMRYGGESTGSLSKILIGNRNILRAFRKNGYKVSLLYPFKRIAPKCLNIIKNKFKL